MLTGVGSLLEPVIRLLLKCGITYAEFAAVARMKFVQVATDDFGIRGRPTNASRVAILTGLDRRLVSKLREPDPDEASSEVAFMSRPSQVLGGWFQDPEFVEPSGAPRDLDFEGDTGSFAALVRRYAPAIPAGAMAKELKATGSVAELGDRKLRALKRAFIPRELSETRIRMWASVLRDVGSAIEHNLDPSGRQTPLFERRAHNLAVDRSAVPEFEEFLRSEGQAFLERMDDWLAAHQADPAAGRKRSTVRLGVGIYEIRDPTSAKRSTPTTPSVR